MFLLAKLFLRLHIKHIKFLLDSLYLLLEGILGDGLSLDRLEFDLRVHLCLPYFNVYTGSQQYSSLTIETG